MRKYRTDMNYGITVVEIDHQAKNSVYFSGSTERHAKQSAFEGYFDTWEEAKANLVSRARINHLVAWKLYGRAQELILKVEAMTKPTEEFEQGS